jgi:aspartate/methionine/tyrosine aminotransferase
MTEGPRLAGRMARIRPFYVMDLLARARRLEAQGRSIIHMEVGEPDFPTPAPIVEAGRRALAEGHHHYTPASGLPELRRAIAGLYLSRFGLSVDPGRILITPGSSGALQLVTGALVGPGERVLLADPGYPCNRHFVALAEGEPVPLPVGPEGGYQPDVAAVQAAWTPGTRALLVASPANPTGTLLERPALAALHHAVRRLGGDLIVDEIYQGLVYEGEEHCALELGEEVFVINSFSKYYGMTGWRLGWVVAPPAYVEPLERLAQNIFLAAPTPAQHAALAAFSIETATILERRRQEFQRRRDFLLPALEALGFRFPARPRGAFYLYADSSALCDDSFRLADDLLERAGVAVTPGLDFGQHRPAQHLRFAYTTSLENLAEGVERMRRFLHGP